MPRGLTHLCHHYPAPAVHKGERVTCHLRGVAIITSWTDTPIAWPRCRALDTSGGGSGLWLDDTLALAVSRESAAAIGYWFGVTEGVVWRWRRALGVTRTNNERSLELIRQSAAKGGEAAGEEAGTRKGRRRRRRTALDLNLIRRAREAGRGDEWTPEEIALLGTMADEDLALQINRTPLAVRLKRERLGIPRRHYQRQPWTPEEDKLVRTLPPKEVARQTGRRMRSVYMRRWELRTVDHEHHAAKAKKKREKAKRKRRRWGG